MRVSILSSRDTSDPNVVFTLSFNVTYGLPSRVLCYHNKQAAAFLDSRDDPNLSREVIRSQYVNSSQPDMTRVTVKVDQPIREDRSYRCEVVVEGRVNIVSGTYTYLKMGPPIQDNSSTVNITGECLTTCTTNAIMFLYFLLSVAGTPTSVTANRTGCNSVLVSWMAPSPQPAGYEVFYQTTAGVSSRLSGGNTSNTEVTLTGLTLGETYYIFVVAFGEEGAPVLLSNRSNFFKCELYAQD